MGLIGMYFLAKTISSSSNYGGGGRYSARREYEERKAAAARERAKELGRIRKAMEAVDGCEITDAVEVPARVLKGVQRLFISKKRNIKHRSIVVLKADENGVQMPETGVDMSKYSVVGVLDDNKLCMFEKDTGDLLIVEATADFDCGPHGDYTATTHPFIEGSKYLGVSGFDLRTSHLSFTRVKANGEIVERDYTPKEFQRITLESAKYYSGDTRVIEFCSEIRRQVKEFREKQALEEKLKQSGSALQTE